VALQPIEAHRSVHFTMAPYFLSPSRHDKELETWRFLLLLGVTYKNGDDLR
jgi:hypothetical protein